MDAPDKPSSPPAFTDRKDLLASGFALGGGALSLFAWAACCVLPLAFSMAGISFAWGSLIAGQRGPLTILALAALALGWVAFGMRRRRCARDATCPRPSRAAFWLLVVATMMVALALVWEPIIEPWAMVRLAVVR